MGATVFVQPLDLVKNRMQMSGECKLLTVFPRTDHYAPSVDPFTPDSAESKTDKLQTPKLQTG